MPQERAPSPTDESGEHESPVAGRRLQRSSAPEPGDSPQIAGLRRDVGADPASAPARVARFWRQVERSGTPLIEPDGRPGHVVVTFLWRGTPPDAANPTGAVLALINRVTDRRNLAASAMTRVPGTDVWYLSYRMASDWLASYQLAPDVPVLPACGPAPAGTAAGPNRAGAADLGAQPHNALLAQARPDPLARHGMNSLWAGPPMSAVYGPAAVQPAHWAEQAGAVPATVSTVHIPGTGPDRAGLDAQVFRPVADPGLALPLLVMLDGHVWADVAGLPAVLDRLIASGALPPLLAVMLRTPQGAARAEYFGCDERFVDDLTGPVLAEVARRWPVSDAARERIVCGQSMGGLAAVWAASQAPEAFGTALSQSGSFWWPSHDASGGRAQWLTGELAAHPPRGLRARLAVGSREPLLLGPTRRLYEVLSAADDDGNDVRLREYNGGHDLLWWRIAVTDALQEALAAH